MNTPKVIVLRPPSLGSDKLTSKLMDATERGFKYGGYAPTAHTGNVGGIYHPRKGLHTGVGIIRVNPTDSCNGSLYLKRSISISTRGKQPSTEEITNETNHLVRRYHSWGFKLADVIPYHQLAESENGILGGTRWVNLLFERQGGAGTDVRLDKRLMKSNRSTEESAVECPVRGCAHLVAHMSDLGGNLDSSKDNLEPCLCPDHRIFISPSMFEYENACNSILWQFEKELEDLKIVKHMATGKRNWTRMAREGNKDSLVWNVFYHLHRADGLGAFVKECYSHLRYSGIRDVSPISTLVWSVDLDEQSASHDLLEARSSMEEEPVTGSEPDVVIETENEVIFVEAKSSSDLVSSCDNENIPEYYQIASDQHDVFEAPVAQVAQHLGQRLMRLIIIGHSLAHELNREFYLTVVAPNEGHDERSVIEKIWPDSSNRLGHITWSGLRRILNNKPISEHRDTTFLAEYLKHKTAGYHPSTGKLQTLLGSN